MLLCTFSGDAYIQLRLIYFFFCTTYLLNQRLKSKKEEIHPGWEWCKEGLPGFTRTIDNQHSDLGLWLISYQYTPLGRYQGRERALLERHRNGPQKQSTHGSPKDNPKCPLHIVSSCSRWSEGQMISLKPTLHLKVLGGKGKWYFIFL